MKMITKLLAAGAALLMSANLSLAAEPVVKVAIGGSSCLCYLPTVLANQLGEYEKAGVKVELFDAKGGSAALTAVLGGSADVVSGYFEHTVNLAAKDQAMQSFVIYDRFPGLVLVVAPEQTGKIKSVADLVGKKVGVSAPGSSTDFFLKFLMKKDGLDPKSAAPVGIGLGATAIAAMEHGQVDAAVMLDPAVTVMQSKYKDLLILADTRTQKDTKEIFGGDYPGGALYTRPEWIKEHATEAQAMTNAIVATLKWIHGHTAEEIMAKMPENFVGADKEAYLSALKNTIPMYSEDGMMDPKGAQAVLDVFKIGHPDAKDIDIKATYTNAFAEKAK